MPYLFREFQFSNNKRVMNIGRKTSFKGKTVLVTGAASGMGRLAASRYAEAGKTVLVVDINAKALKTLEAEYKNVHRIVLDITDYEAVNAAVKKAEKKYDAIERLVNCAALLL